jgi:hypothetical protein
MIRAAWRNWRAGLHPKHALQLAHLMNQLLKLDRRIK